MKLDARETASVLAGLRLLQVVPARTQPSGVRDIADDGGQFEPLSHEEIDALCEKINFSE